MEQLEKAMLVAEWRQGEEGEETEFIPVQFNPAEFSLDRSNQIAEIAIPGLDSPLLQFVRGNNEKLTMDLFFDTTGEKDEKGDSVSVTTHTDRIYELAKIQPKTHAPPVCAFLWSDKFPGGNTSENIGKQKRSDFQCVFESVKQKFTLFSPKGIPLRATLTVTLREYKTLDEQLKEIGKGSPDRTHNHVTQKNDNLSSIAGRYYQQAGEWRHIANENSIDDPRRIPIGSFFIIPPIG